MEIINIKIGVISMLHENVIIRLLQNVELYRFFNQLIIAGHRWEQIQINDEHLNKNNIVYIDNNQQNIQNACKYCKVINIPHRMNILPALKLLDLEYIESIFNVFKSETQIFDEETFPYHVPQSMIKENINIYNAIKTEIMMNKRNNISIQNLSVIKYIKKDMNDWRFKDCFIDFAWKFYDALIMLQNKEYWWTANILQQLIKMERNDYELHCMFGKALSYLHLDEIATNHYNLSISINPDSISNHESFGWHLFHCKQYQSALCQFDICLKLKKNENIALKNSNFLLIFARWNDYCHHNEIAEEFYLKAIEFDAKRNRNHSGKYHGYYGAFLLKEQRLNEAKIEYEKAMKIDPENHWYPYKISNILWKMELKQQHSIYLIKSLQLNPFNDRARNDYRKYFGKEYDEDIDDGGGGRNEMNEEYKEYEEKEEKEENNNNNNNRNQSNSSSQSISLHDPISITSTAQSSYHPKSIFQKEFNRWYWMKFGDDDKVKKNRFNGYFVLFILKEMNDIRIILKYDIKTLRKQIKQQINIRNNDDLKRICDLFREIKDSHIIFIEWLTINGIDKFVREQIFDYNGIFTMDALPKKKEDLINIICKNDIDIKCGENNKLIDKIWILIQSIINH